MIRVTAASGLCITLKKIPCFTIIDTRGGGAIYKRPQFGTSSRSFESLEDFETMRVTAASGLCIMYNSQKDLGLVPNWGLSWMAPPPRVSPIVK